MVNFLHLVLLVIYTNASVTHNQHGRTLEACAEDIVEQCADIDSHAHATCGENFEESGKADRPLLIKDYTTHIDCVVFSGWSISKRTWK
jgi:hypothetical protein